MQCPICSPIALQQVQLEENLLGQQCPQCQGLFLPSTNYWEWLAKAHSHDTSKYDVNSESVLPERRKAIRCPACLHMLLPYKIAVDIDFMLEHCGHCNSMWLDRGEWAILRQRGLHDHLHQVSGEPWQRQLRKEEHKLHMQAIYRDKFGEADYTEIQRIKAWLDAHSQRLALRAYLNAEDPYQP